MYPASLYSPIRKLNVANEWYEHIKSGTKRYEGRPVEKIQDISVGQTIAICSPDKPDLVFRVIAKIELRALSMFPLLEISADLVIPTSNGSTSYNDLYNVYERYYPGAINMPFGFLLLDRVPGDNPAIHPTVDLVTDFSD